MDSIQLRDLGELDPDSPTARDWDRLVSEPACLAGFMQSSHWAHFKRQLGFKVVHLGLYLGNELVGGAVFYTAANNKGAGFLAAPDGPVLPWHNSELACAGMQLLLAAAREQSRTLGTMALRIAPRLLPPKPAFLDCFAAAPLNLTEHKTLYLNLQPSSEELLQAMKPKCRYNIGLSARKGVSVREESALSAALNLYSVMEEVSCRNDYYLEPLSFFVSLIESLCPSGMARIFFAEHEGDILGALLLLQFGKRASYFAGGTTDTKRNLMGGYALQWAAINAARESGCDTYDFWGYDPTADEENTYAGFSRFKSQFGGDAQKFIGTFDHVFMDHLASVVIRAMKEIHSEP